MSTYAYLHITANHSTGVLARVSNLMRKRNYNMEEVSVNFDKEGQAHIGVLLNAEKLDADQVASQVSKLHDVSEVTINYDLSGMYASMYIYDVQAQDFEGAAFRPSCFLEIQGSSIAICMVHLDQVPALKSFVNSHGWRRRERFMDIS